MISHSVYLEYEQRPVLICRCQHEVHRLHQGEPDDGGPAVMAPQPVEDVAGAVVPVNLKA